MAGLRTVASNVKQFLRELPDLSKTEDAQGLVRHAAWQILPTPDAGRWRYMPEIVRFFQDKHGLEIGGPTPHFERFGLLPIYPIAAGLDNCNFGSRTVWEGDVKEGRTFRFHGDRSPGRQFVAEAASLPEISTETYDFVLSSNMLEHSTNPLACLQEWKRVLKPEGLLLLLLPHKEMTFDHRRPVTSLEHMKRDFERGTPESDLEHMEEILALHDLAADPLCPQDPEEFRARCERNAENRCLHHHVFTTPSAVELVDYDGWRILAVKAHKRMHICIAAQKTSERPDNSAFLQAQSACRRLSPFPLDRPAGV